MKTHFYLLIFVCLSGLQSCGKKVKIEDDGQIQLNVDTNTLEGKARFIWDILQREYPMMGGCDTLIDMNGDSMSDLVIMHYGSAGSGMKWMVTLYLYNPGKGQFEANGQLQAILNPTFEFKNKTVFSWYLGNGGGYGTKMKWNKNKSSLDTLEVTAINVLHRDDLLFKFLKTDYRTGKETSWVSQELPPEFTYAPLIKKPECN